jgi:ribonuclease H / adenosylcobalamin/alpha-ribazole phosphatase
MKLSDPLSILDSTKRTLAEKIFNSLLSIQGVVSVTFVGSFCEHRHVSEISDIDVIVICDTLLRPLYEQCINAIQKMTGMELGYPDKQVYINSSFGPLKFDTLDQIVIHLMIYDRESHRRHVLESPFTCFDWERSPVNMGQSLQEMYPVLNLQPGDFFKARRGLEDYISDLEQGVLSYRVYEFDQNGHPIEIKKTTPLDSRHRGEYAYHIVRNLISNYAKLLFQKNLVLSQKTFYDFWNEHLIQARHLIPHFQDWEHIKAKREMDFPKNTLTLTKEFLDLFGSMLKQQWTSQSKRIVFIRHAKTEFNDGSFLGQRRDPDILNEKILPLEENFDFIYSSPLKRAIHTAKIICSGIGNITIDNRLAEQDYGEADGLSIEQLQQKFPEVVTGWAQGKDVQFPNGENTSDVENRLFAFLNALSQESQFPKLVVTHNVVMRCLLGNLLGLAQKDWYKLNPGYLEPYELILSNGHNPKSWYLNLTKQQKASLIDNLKKNSSQITTEQVIKRHE